ncbi:hypothetical protein JQS43_15775 [Natronosporangium hydrolyticum]|uniref:Acetone carboxylase n=2 Tax=Natronosporangium hydrolyticum TaxID=2811111 RepID=A0A895YN24_9ACTN|nr:hypothetical protein [Natronosporangium hydrolyticum]QSB17362.1 hypothetical protein JQS43_15775 [Natronosporangium hydrolyticum]
MLDPSTPQDGPDQLVCSAKGCRRPAIWALRWHNPKLHTPDRRKTWLACDEHRQYLSDFLDARGFLRDVAALE